LASHCTFQSSDSLWSFINAARLVALAISSSPVAFRNRVSLQLASVVTPEINQNINSPPTGFQDPEKGGWEQWDHLGSNIVRGGGKRVYTRSRREAKKLIPVSIFVELEFSIESG
jgi:hypothetical protein